MAARGTIYDVLQRNSVQGCEERRPTVEDREAIIVEAPKIRNMFSCKKPFLATVHNDELKGRGLMIDMIVDYPMG